MKQYNRFLYISIGMYFVMVILCTSYFQKNIASQSKQYLVDINRIEATIEQPSDIDQINLSTYSSIISLTYLSFAQNSMESIQSFYEAENQANVVFRPYFLMDEQIGVVKYTYQVDNEKLASLFWLIQASLLVMEIFIILILMRIKHQVLTPFQQLSTLPLQLAKGHFKGEIIIQKTGYLRDFLWGMSQLKDAFDIAKKRQVELEKEKKQLLLSLSHDIKTPLNMIKLYGKAIRENVYEDSLKTQMAMDNISKRCDQIEGYVNEIMKHSREDILDIQVENGEFYLSYFVKQIKQTYQSHCAQRMLELKIHSFEDRLIKGDCDRLQEVMENLFENAFKYGDGRKIEISFEEEDYCQLIHFYNTGEIVSEEEWNHLFDSFYRGKNAKGMQGSGLGLYICKTIMRKMDGDVYLERREQGMEFVLVIR